MSQRFTVLIGTPEFGRYCPEVFDDLREANCTVLRNEFHRWFTEDELIERVTHVDALIAGLEPITARVIAAAPRLKVVSRQGVGVDNVDLAAAKARGIPVAITTGTLTESVAEMALALLLALARQIPQGNAAVKAGQWSRCVGLELAGRTLGVIGLGQIGKAVCLRATCLGMQLLAHDPHADDSFAASQKVELVSLNDLLARADFVSLHLPSNMETRRVIGAPQLSQMKRSAYLINTARGPLVDEGALYEALRSGQIAGAASDVFEQEPPGDHPLLQLGNFIATPHSASSTEDALGRMDKLAVANALRVLGGGRALYEVAGE